MIDLLRILVVFVLIIVLLRRRTNLGIAMLVGSLALGVLFLMPPIAFADAAITAAISQSTITLMLALLLIMALENVMRRTGMLKLMVDSLSAVIPDRRVVMALLPAFLGFLPSAGGARFSAPMVGEVSEGLDLTPERKSFINYWYRHIWEFTFPLYPSLILAAQLIGVSLGDLIRLLFPFTILAILVGMPFAFRGIDPRRATDTRGVSTGHLRDLIVGLSPILAVTIAVVAFQVDIVISLLCVVLALLIVHRYTPSQSFAMAKQAFSPNIVLLVYSVMVFKEVMTRSGGVNGLPDFFSSLGIPGAVVVFTLPFLIGVTTGYAQAPVAVGFPLIMSLMGYPNVNPAMVVLGFVGGFAGVMVSPAHLCLVLTVDHFKASVGRVLRIVLVPEALLVLVAIAYVVR